MRLKDASEDIRVCRIQKMDFVLHLLQSEYNEVLVSRQIGQHPGISLNNIDCRKAWNRGLPYDPYASSE